MKKIERKDEKRMKETLPKSIQKLILSLREKLKDEPEIVDMFERCYSNTLDTTVKKMEDGSTYVITGDIPAMWLRDRKSTRLNSSHIEESRMPSSA